MTTSELLKKWYDEVWNKANEGFIDEMMGMKNSVLALIVFFVLGFIGLAITRKKQMLVGESVDDKRYSVISDQQLET